MAAFVEQIAVSFERVSLRIVSVEFCHVRSTNAFGFEEHDGQAVVLLFQLAVAHAFGEGESGIVEGRVLSARIEIEDLVCVLDVSTAAFPISKREREIFRLGDIPHVADFKLPLASLLPSVSPVSAWKALSQPAVFILELTALGAEFEILTDEGDCVSDVDGSA